MRVLGFKGLGFSVLGFRGLGFEGLGFLSLLPEFARSVLEGSQLIVDLRTLL